MEETVFIPPVSPPNGGKFVRGCIQDNFSPSRDTERLLSASCEKLQVRLC